MRTLSWFAIRTKVPVSSLWEDEDSMNPQRILRQKLEDLQRAGVSHVPQELAEFVTTLNETSPAGTTDTTRIPSQPPPPRPAARTASQRQDDESQRRPETGSGVSTARALSNSALPQDSPTPQVERRYLASSDGSLPKEYSASMTDTSRPCSNLSRDERIARLSSIAEQVAACTRCQDLADTRTQTVFGVGNPEAEIMFVGEAPGADEDKQGEPFVGRAGKLLNKIIEASGLTREEIYICNILRCRPPGNRTPNPIEAGNCREFLDAQIDAVDPKYIVCWGSCAAHNLLDTKVAIGKMRGKFFDYKGIKVLCTYHPSYLLRSPGAKKLVWEDMQFFRADMGVKLK